MRRKNGRKEGRRRRQGSEAGERVFKGYLIWEWKDKARPTAEADVLVTVTLSLRCSSLRCIGTLHLAGLCFFTYCVPQGHPQFESIQSSKENNERAKANGLPR